MALSEKKPRMRPADEIFSRLKWDPDCPVAPENVTIGYEDRFLGILEISISAFEDPEAEIPFHRIRYFRTTDTAAVFWDRRRRIDALTASFNGNANDHHNRPNATAPIEPAGLAPPRSGQQKKKALQAKRLAKREDVKVSLVDEIVNDDAVEHAQAAVLPLTLEQVERQRQRVEREQREERRAQRLAEFAANRRTKSHSPSPSPSASSDELNVNDGDDNNNDEDDAALFE